MRLGIFAKTFPRPTVEQTLDAVAGLGLTCVQFNMSCAGLPPMPESIEPGLAARIRAACETRGIEMAAVSGTFNMAHPDVEHRRGGLQRLETLAGACRLLGTRLITLCTGSRDRENMWKADPDNGGPAAWRDLVDSLEQAVEIAERHDIWLGIEPEVSNVIDSARRARRLLDEMGSPRLKIVMDGANIFHAGELPRMREILDEAGDLLGPDIGLAHAKDLAADGAAGDRAAGAGVLDYDRYLRMLRRCNYHGPLILHGLTEQEAPAAVDFLRGMLSRG